jgi:AcrR family transcriptional regulator
MSKTTGTDTLTDAPTPRNRRHRALADLRREHILIAAREAFFELGLEGASLREIAKRAGYTPGAIYSYFPSKEEVYATLLAESLERLNSRVAAAELPGSMVGQVTADNELRLRALAFFDFYRENPRDLDLGFYLFHGMQPRGVTPQWNDRLNGRLRHAMQLQEAALRALGFSDEDATTEVTALFAHTVGLLLLRHTGRIRMFGRESKALFVRYVEDLVRRAPARQNARRRR